uniref:Uncharacterized protein LOC103960496 n=1 Tax=Rhizophora mucronata TaxID=61149 RepID=A0A2P2IW41_RHIMU
MAFPWKPPSSVTQRR